MSLVTQITAVSVLNVRNIPQRFGTSLVVVVGIACVVAVLISVLSMSMGFRRTIENSGRPDRAIVLSQGADSEAASNLARADAIKIGDAPGVKKNLDGRSLTSAEALIVAPVAKKDDGSDAYVTLRGIGPQGFEVRPEFKLTAGRMFRPAVHELLVGAAAQAQFKNLQIGDRIVLREGEWTVVGTFTSSGNSHESELIADTDTVLSAYRLNVYKSVTVQLASVQSFTAFKDALTSDPALTVDVKLEPDYFANLSRPLNKLLDLVAYVIGSMMAVGALFGALNTMYSAVSSRATEIAMLRAIGFGGGAVVVSVFFEALLLALIGAGLGVAIAYVLFNGNAMSTIGGAVASSQLVYSLEVTPVLIAVGVAVACLIGFLGGLFPAVRAARLSVASALRAN